MIYKSTSIKFLDCFDQEKLFYMNAKHFFNSAILFAMGKNKTALIQLERPMDKAPRLLKKFVELNPSILQNQQVVDLIARFKRNKSI